MRLRISSDSLTISKPRTVAVPEVARPRYIQDAYLETSTLALDRIRLETIRFGEQTFEEMMIGYFDWIPEADETRGAGAGP